MTDKRFARFGWFFLAYLVLVILFGAWVRISGSGDGCGSHWPTCQGEVIPLSPSAKTLTEFAHRVSSALCGVFGIVLVIWAKRVSRPAFKAACLTLFFLLVESLIGAVLVKKELVAGNASVSRAVAVSLHLANTLFLTASAATVTWWASGWGRTSWPRASAPLLGAVLAGMLVTNMTGAVTALGDTLFPTQPAWDGSLLARLSANLSPGEHFLVRLRIVHPVVASVAAGLGLVMFFLLSKTQDANKPQLSRLARWGGGLTVLQVAFGVVNVLLAAPTWMQILHLLLAQAVWVAVWFATIAAWNARRDA